MRLYLSADSKNKIGYVPDWLKISFKENGQEQELVLDVHGEIDYDNERLDCRCKGDLIPWVLWNLTTGEETDLSQFSEEELNQLFPVEKLIDMICKSEYYEVGIYPTNATDEVFALAEHDILSDCKGMIELYDGSRTYTKRFEFETELNI